MSTNHQALYTLLIECCRHESDDHKLEYFAGQISDWAGFLESSYTHGVYPLVAKSLKSIHAVPEHIKSVLKITNLDIARRNMTMTAELLRIMKLLEENGISALAIKGPVLSQMIYGDITQRQFADLDILVQEKDLYRTVELLCDNGFVSEHSIKFLKNKELLQVLKDFSIMRPSQNISIEIHWKLFLQSQIKNDYLHYFYQNSNKVIINNYYIKTLDHNSLILYLILHGSKHMWERLEWIADVDRLARNKDADWDNILTSARRMKSEQLFNLGIVVCRELFSTPFPVRILENSEAMHSVLNPKSLILGDLFSNSIVKGDLVLHDEINYIFFEDIYKSQWIYKLILFYRAFTRLDPDDFYTINLPRYLAFFYRFIHLFHVAHRMISNKYK